jgi:Cathepsin propeptide inhibitor domain (I29)
MYKSSFEERNRWNIFKLNVEKIRLMNLEEEGDAEFGVTQFSDMTESEFKSKVLMPPSPPKEFK